MDYKTAAQCARLSADVYQDFQEIQFREVPGIQPHLIDQEATDTQLAILHLPEDKVVFVVFRGSEKKLSDWATNFNFDQTDENLANPSSNEPTSEVRQRVRAELKKSDPYQKGYKSEMHEGFANAYLSVRNQIRGEVGRHEITKVIVTGHSLGGALATLCGLDLQYNFPDLSVAVYTYGSPKVGNGAFARTYKRRVPDTFRFVFGQDIVPRVPMWWMGYRHVTQKLGLGPRLSWRILSRRVKDHKIANYIEALQQRI